jgi:hypothetical protein
MKLIWLKRDEAASIERDANPLLTAPGDVQGMRTPSALKTRLKRSGMPMGLATSSDADTIHVSASTAKRL